MNRVDPWFDLLLTDDVVRTMSREDYYMVRSYVRKMRRSLMKDINKTIVSRAIEDVITHGHGGLLVFNNG
tara:strand:+ start:517 stop:726 length:210 start_codon:yes stop_codon:yes gene_type:complete